jgi:hypothetical protein
VKDVQGHAGIHAAALPANPAEDQAEQRARQDAFHGDQPADAGVKQAEDGAREANCGPGRQSAAERSEQVAAKEHLFADRGRKG